MKRLLFILSVCLLGCKKDPALWEIKNLNGGSIYVFGHGGLGNKSLYPMDSYRSLEGALATGADGTEMDLQLSDDSVLVLFHGQHLEDMTSGHGIIPENDWDVIEQCEYSGVMLNEHVIEANYLFDRISTENKIFTFDCKFQVQDIEHFTLFANELVKLIYKYNLVNKCYIESPYPEFMKLLYERDHRLKLFLYTDDCSFGIENAADLHLYGIVMDWKRVTAAEITQAHASNLRFTLFNCSNEKENLEVIQMNPDNIQTDKLEHLVQVLKKEK